MVELFRCVSLFAQLIPDWCLLPASARSSILNAFEESITRGSIEIEEATKVTHYGTYNEGCKALRLKVLADGFWIRVFMWVKFYLVS